MTPTINTTNSINTNNTNNTNKDNKDNKDKGEKAAAAAVGQEERGVKRPLPVPKKRNKGAKPRHRNNIRRAGAPSSPRPHRLPFLGGYSIDMVDIDMIGIDTTGTDMIGTGMIGIDIDMRAPNRRSTSRPKQYFE